MAVERPDMAGLVATERVACVLRLAVGLLLLAMTLQFDPIAAWLAVSAIVTALGWSALMTLALRSHLTDEQVLNLATWSHWFDIVLALTVYASFLADPVATPVAGLPLLAYRLAVRYGTVGVVAGALTFAGLVGARIVFTRVTVGEGLVRPPLLLAWALVATVVLMLAAESRGRFATGNAGTARGTKRASAGLDTAFRGRPSSTSPAEPPSATTLTGDERLDSLAAGLSLKPANKPANAAAVRLTERELEVLLLLGQGHSYAKVAGRLFISQSTVRNHVHNIRVKLDIPGREEMLRLAKAVAERAAGADELPRPGVAHGELASPT